MDLLLQQQERLRREFDREPFKYIVIDNFLREDAAQSIFSEFPSVNRDWVDARGLHTQNKWTCPVVDKGVAAKFVLEVNSPEFLSFLESITGVPQILKDPTLLGAGYHQTTAGGFLNVHVDFNKHHDDLGLDRRLNMIVYFNKRWNEANGGYLELWDMGEKKRLENISPVFNRCVIFETNEVSFHGHPVPVNVDQGESRKSLSIYYYSRGRSDILPVAPHNTIYVNTESWRGIPKIVVNGVKHAFRKLRQRP